MPRFDAAMKGTLADTLAERTAQEPAKILREMAQALDPFPSFLNMPTIQALEIEPGGFRDTQRGCVVVCHDGELYELTLEMSQAPPELGGEDQVEKFKPLELSPAEYIPYALSGIRALVQAHQEGERGRPLPKRRSVISGS